MTYMLILLGGAMVIGALWLASRLRRIKRRSRLLGATLPVDYLDVLDRNLPLYRRMPAGLREQLHGIVNVLLDEKRFIGCGGLQVTDEMRVTIAGHASLLLLNRPGDYYPGFTSILVYPDTYVADEVSYDGDVEIHEHVERVGESWHRGPVVLSWQDILHGLSAHGAGMNVILHEFAHKLDEQNGETEGLPVLHDDDHYTEWTKVLGREFATLSESVATGNDSVLDEYAATSPAEFFAVATEAFFESSQRMRDELPALYRQLQRYYAIDPASWHG